MAKFADDSFLLSMKAVKTVRVPRSHRLPAACSSAPLSRQGHHYRPALV